MKAQGSLEYLLILAAILAIAVVVVVIANSMLNPAQSASTVSADKYECQLAGIELVGYDTPYNGMPDTAPESIKTTYRGQVYNLPPTTPYSKAVFDTIVVNSPTYHQVCTIGTQDFRVFKSNDTLIAVNVFVDNVTDGTFVMRYYLYPLT